MVTILAKKRAVVAVDLSDDSTTKAVLVSSDGDRFMLERWEFYSEQTSGGADLTQGYKPEAITAILGDGHTICFAAPELDGYNIEMEKRKRGVAAAALAGALSEIGRLGGGRVESFPEDAEGRSVSASFLHNGTLAMFERAGFAMQRRLGKDRWLVTKEVTG